MSFFLVKKKSAYNGMKYLDSRLIIIIIIIIIINQNFYW